MIVGTWRACLLHPCTAFTSYNCNIYRRHNSAAASFIRTCRKHQYKKNSELGASTVLYKGRILKKGRETSLHPLRIPLFSRVLIKLFSLRQCSPLKRQDICALIYSLRIQSCGMSTDSYKASYPQSATQCFLFQGILHFSPKIIQQLPISSSSYPRHFCPSPILPSSFPLSLFQ